MLPVSQELKGKLEKLNESLRKIYPMGVPSRQEIRARLQQVGEFYQIEKGSESQWKDWLQGKTLLGVDGSVNSTKGAEMRTLSVFQALAKGTRGEEKWAADVYTPLLDNLSEPEEGQAAREARKRGAHLSCLEMQVAKEAMMEWEPRVVMLDGSLLHFYIDDGERWEDLARCAEEKQVYMVGVTEEIGTRGLVRELFPDFPVWTDRDLLYGILHIGEAFVWEDWSSVGNQMWKMVLRSSQSPVPIGIDGLVSQQSAQMELVRLVYSLTPKQGRGIPFWLDIVDNQVRVTDALVQTMVEKYLDPDLRYRLLASKQEERII